MVVDLGKGICTCGLWQLSGAPKKKIRKGVDEGPVGGKKQKNTKMKRVYKEGSRHHCGMSQPMVSENKNEESHQVNQSQARPPKLPQKRRQPPPAATASIPPAATSAPPPSVSNAPPPATVPISNTPPPTSARINPMVGVSAATASRLRNTMHFVPTSGFKPPRKFNKRTFCYFSIKIFCF
ncbi:hypothetical protein Ahy_A10g050177 [Arachis hypogaea]|uniref:Uncharacterized protein n=1 Tax=Arachis hypogaea TaxID=3818 RepID=A0A445B8Q5_ARAHY|nr:hypothetical protein Ahy_A10g050177 [Arachis hypogaea]